jgi:hypothetical protein
MPLDESNIHHEVRRSDRKNGLWHIEVAVPGTEGTAVQVYIHPSSVRVFCESREIEAPAGA